MPEYKYHPYEFGLSPTCTTSSYTTVEQAEAALKAAKERERQQRKAAKRAAKVAAQKAADNKAGLAALREIAADTRRYSADARVIAAQALATL